MCLFPEPARRLFCVRSFSLDVKKGALYIIILSLFAATGCDTYSLLDQFDSLNKPSITPQKTTLQRWDTIDLNPRGGEEPYTFFATAEDLYPPADPGLTDDLDYTYTAGDSIGKVRIVLTDKAGASADAVVTIVPPTPDDFVATPDGPNGIALSWTYVDTTLISGFTVELSVEGGEFIETDTLGNNIDSVVYGTLNPGKLYSYRIYANSGDFKSMPSLVESVQL